MKTCLVTCGLWLGDAATGVSPETVGAIIGSLIIALIGGGYLGKRAADNRIRIADPLPVVTTRKQSTPPTWDQHAGLERRVTVIEQGQSEMRREMALQYREILESGGMREIRLTEKLEGIARGIHARIDAMFPPIPRKP